MQGKKLPADEPAAHSFKMKFLSYLPLSTVDRDSVYNADKIGLNWKALPRKALTSHTRAAAFCCKVSMDCITAMICASSGGSHRLPVHIV